MSLQKLYYTTTVNCLSELHPSDHIRVNRGIYHHHMLVVEVVSGNQLKVIHYTGAEELEEAVDGAASSASSSAVSSSFSLGSAGQMVGEVKEELLPIKPNDIQLLKYRDPSTSMYCAVDAIDRARTRLGERRYSVVGNNCEHFVNWAKTGSAKSHQTRVAAMAVLEGVKEGCKAGKENESFGWAVLKGLDTTLKYFQQQQDNHD